MRAISISPLGSSAFPVFFLSEHFRPTCLPLMRIVNALAQLVDSPLPLIGFVLSVSTIGHSNADSGITRLMMAVHTKDFSLSILICVLNLLSASQPASQPVSPSLCLSYGQQHSFNTRPLLGERAGRYLLPFTANISERFLTVFGIQAERGEESARA